LLPYGQRFVLYGGNGGMSNGILVNVAGMVQV
jgi:hypothetical protein